jgi:predicted kinase
MIPHVLIINGPPGVGKSTVASALRVLMPGTICISGDALRGFAPAGVRTALGPGSTYRAAAGLAAFYLKAGATRVVFEYVFETPKQLEHFTAAITAGTPLQVVTLWASRATIESRDALRESANRQGGRVAESIFTMAPHLQNLGCVVDTDIIPATEIAARVHQFACGIYEPAA